MILSSTIIFKGKYCLIHVSLMDCARLFLFKKCITLWHGYLNSYIYSFPCCKVDVFVCLLHFFIVLQGTVDSTVEMLLKLFLC